jgi:peptide/nickel transport system ATP-binding protein
MLANQENKLEEEYLLEVKDLQTFFKTEESIVKAVNNISLKLKRGETLGIVGESGSGKSVTALSIMHLIPNPPGRISGGEIIFNSPSRGKINLVNLPENDMQDIRGNEISMIFQEPMTSLNPVYTCGDQVMEAILLHQKLTDETGLQKFLESAKKLILNYTLFYKLFTKKRYLTKRQREAKRLTIELFNKVELPRPEDIFDSYPHQISGGQKQRVMIAMAMSCHPSILIADEPTTALDVTVQAKILDLMRHLRDENDMSIIFITHDLGVIAEIADRVAVMYQGKIVEQGTVWEIFSNPQHPYTKGLLACRPRLELKLKVLPVVSGFMGKDAEGNLVEKTFSSVGQAI